MRLPPESRVMLALLALGIAAACQAAQIKSPGGGGGAAVAGPGGASGSDRGGAAGAASTDALALPDATGSGASAPTAPAPGTSCLAEQFDASPVAVDLVFVIDQSPSMNFMIGDKTKWQLAREALIRFLGDPGSAGLGVGFQFFPTPSMGAACTSDEDCGFLFACAAGGKCRYPFEPFPSCAVADYSRLSVPIADLPANAPALTASLNRVPNPSWGASPMGVAAQGAFKYLRGRLATTPGRQTAIVLVSDGVPSGCFSGWTRPEEIVAGLAAEVRLTPSIRTFVIGLFSDRREDQGGEAALGQFATAGGSGMPFFVRPPEDVSANFLTALNQIRAATLPCEYVIPAARADMLDFQKVNLRYKSPTREEDIPYVARAERCDPTRGGWYYDIDPTMGRPTRLIACPATCATFKSETGPSRVSLAYGCRTRTID